MRKLSLDLDDLEVESFSAEDTPAERGTVVGQNAQGTVQLDCTVICWGTQLCTTGCYTWWLSCGGTCFDVSECGSCPVWECGA
jgi:hypothetical protein